ncbi:MAG: TIGR04076 family protein [Spirochaetes bacterium]|nr:TIGR04076 family protein [Spirochaetota bacterium]
MNAPEKMYEVMQKHLGYTDEEMVLFKKNPANEAVLATAPELMNKTIVFEVIESNGCNSHHKVGDRFYFDGAGNLITALNPKKVCIYALQAMLPVIFASNELMYNGVDPNRIKFNHAGCFDVGVKCGGWGRIILRYSMEDRKK